ncbi:GKN2 protein, partial [Pluvianellus socialis]|nr:GKN2 protein [Pluvianellus socialis]
YSQGYIATRLFSRTACYIMKINKAYIPDLQEIRRLALERQTMHTPYSPKNLWLEYQSGRSMRGTYEDWLIYGEHIQQLCRGLPLHQ